MRFLYAWSFASGARDTAQIEAVLLLEPHPGQRLPTARQLVAAAGQSFSASSSSSRAASHCFRVPVTCFGIAALRLYVTS
jgi:hypothetical protein